MIKCRECKHTFNSGNLCPKCDCKRLVEVKGESKLGKTISQESSSSDVLRVRDSATARVQKSSRLTDN